MLMQIDLTHCMPTWHRLQRSTVGNQSCQLPAVFGGYLNFDCALRAASNSSSEEICPSQA